MDKEVTIDEMLRASANRDGWWIHKIKIGVVIILILIAVAVVVAIAGCAPNHNDYLAARFEEFNADVQAGLEDCRADPNACKPTLELMAAETAVWAEILADPNL